RLTQAQKEFVENRTFYHLSMNPESMGKHRITTISQFYKDAPDVMVDTSHFGRLQGMGEELKKSLEKILVGTGADKLGPNEMAKLSFKVNVDPNMSLDDITFEVLIHRPDLSPREVQIVN